MPFYLVIVLALKLLMTALILNVWRRKTAKPSMNMLRDGESNSHKLNLNHDSKNKNKIK